MGQLEEHIGGRLYRWGKAPLKGRGPEPLNPGAGGSVLRRLNSCGDDMEAVVPGSVVEAWSEVIRHHFQELFNKHLHATSEHNYSLDNKS